MTIQLPVLSKDQQLSNARTLQKRQSTPFTFQINEVVNAGNFPNAIAPPGPLIFNWKSLSWKVPNTLFITRFRYSSLTIGGTNTASAQVNFVNTLFGGNALGGNNFTGNCLFACSSNPDDMDLSPHGYYVARNTVLYIVFGAGPYGAQTSVQSLTIDAIVTPYKN